MSEAKSLVVWKVTFDVEPEVLDECLDKYGSDEIMCKAQEYAHDLTGRFLGVFREVRA